MLKIEIIHETYGNYQFLINKKDIHEVHPHDTNPNAVVFIIKHSGNYSHSKYTVAGSLKFWEDILKPKNCIPKKE